MEYFTHIVTNERIVSFSQVTSPGEVCFISYVQSHVWRHGRMIWSTKFRDDRGNGGIFVTFGVQTRLGLEVRRLHHRIWLMIALATIHRADERALVEDCCAFWQILANAYTRQLRWDRGKRASSLGRYIGLHVPGIDVTGPPRHPQENDALVAPNRLAVL